MPLLNWFSSLSKDLFITANRPIFLIIDNTKSQRFADYVCHLLAILGADVVRFIKVYPSDLISLDFFDGIVCITDVGVGIELVYSKTCQIKKIKNYKKVFDYTLFDNTNILKKANSSLF